MSNPHLIPYQHGRLILPLLVLAVAACCGKAEIDIRSLYTRLADIPEAKWEILSSKKIFFGHKSVGSNILEGLQDVMRVMPSVKLNIRETVRSEDFEGPVFAHAQIGSNKDPSSKIKAFRSVLEGGVGKVADIAVFKFCFVDIDHTTDIRALFKEYEEAIASLQGTFPRLQIVTMTVPLLSRPIDTITKIKKFLGRMPREEEGHIQRNIFNQMLRARFGRSVYDLARTEATLPNGKKASLTKNGQSFDLLHKAYTDDGGHLNSLGRQVVAVDLLRYLVSSVPD